MREWLKELRKINNMPQSKVAAELGINQSYYSMIENGDRQQALSLEFAQKVSNLFGVPIEEIVRIEMENHGN